MSKLAKIGLDIEEQDVLLSILRDKITHFRYELELFNSDKNYTDAEIAWFKKHADYLEGIYNKLTIP